MPFVDEKLVSTEIGELDGRTVHRLDAMIAYCPEGDIFSSIRVPIGFQTDLASVPRIPVVFLFWGDRAHRPAVLHDYLYRIDSKPTCSKWMADGLFREAIVSTVMDGTLRGLIKAYTIAIPMWLGVVLGGKGSYHKLRVDSQLIEWVDPVQ